MASVETVEKLVFNRVSELLCGQLEWTDADRVNVLSQYMKLFGSSWKETLEAYSQQQTTTDQPSEPVCQASPTASESDKQVDDAVEEAAIEYEAVMVSTTRQRSTAPAKLSKLRGSAIRFRLMAAKNQRVDLPLRAPAECPSLNRLLAAADAADGSEGDGHVKSGARSLRQRLLSCNESLSDAALSVQADTQRLRNLSTALSIVTSNAQHPTHKLLFSGRPY